MNAKVKIEETKSKKRVNINGKKANLRTLRLEDKPKFRQIKINNTNKEILDKVMKLKIKAGRVINNKLKMKICKSEKESFFSKVMSRYMVRSPNITGIKANNSSGKILNNKFSGA